MKIKVNAEMFGKAFYFTGGYLNYYPRIGIVPSHLGGVNIIATDGKRLVIFNDENGECSSKGASIGPGLGADEKSKWNEFIKNTRLARNCSKDIDIKFVWKRDKGIGKAVFDRKTFEFPVEVQIEKPDMYHQHINQIRPKKFDAKEKIDMYSFEILKSLQHLNLRSLKDKSKKKFKGQFFSVNKDKNGMFIATSMNVFFLAMPLHSVLSPKNLYDLWAGASNEDMDLFEIALAKKSMIESIEEPYVQSIFHAFSTMKTIKRRNKRRN
tara:strand:- start:566 stop:1366 length:801 start_codon:yes stop_codon:yes gene_type:complete